MSHDKVPTGKIARAGKFLKTGVKVGANYAGHYTKKAVGMKVSKDELDTANANTIFDGFTELRGSALKVAQMLSMDSINFSESFTNVMQKAQYNVPPMSAPSAVNAFKKSTGKAPSEVFDKFNPNAVAAASMGQVHEAWLGDKKLAVKIQYPGVGDSIKSDMKLVRTAAIKVMRYPAAELGPYFQERPTTRGN
jgi:predicted unusual protein kinase regulating ubiquinone biosynthesis (AarF/ABC1/UbiB family)